MTSPAARSAYPPCRLTDRGTVVERLAGHGLIRLMARPTLRAAPAEQWWLERGGAGSQDSWVFSLALGRKWGLVVRGGRSWEPGLLGSVLTHIPLGWACIGGQPLIDRLFSLGQLSDEEEADGTEGKAAGKKPLGKGGDRKYVPPRLVPVHYDETAAEREKKALERAKKRALSSSVIWELKEQFSEAPEEIREGRYLHATRQSQEDEHRRVRASG
ncbi:neuroguidin [Chelonoidis abingdonii]|uniref:neuroguidin n=1 Tax=Chelonoidis abingdonii TaxID=106734 RepID=UPI003F49844D